MNKLKPSDQKTDAKPGFFTRILNKMDDKIKAKADEAAKSQCCDPNDKGKGGKCC